MVAYRIRVVRQAAGILLVCISLYDALPELGGAGHNMQTALFMKNTVF